MPKPIKFNRFDHDDALRAIYEAENLKANVSKNDITTLGSVAGSYACNDTSYFSRKDFSEALARVQKAIELARSNPK